jgi:transcription initiation factor TFIIIB Brf1 subunit/transcription initiation factor TFIIB
MSTDELVCRACGEVGNILFTDHASGDILCNCGAVFSGRLFAWDPSDLERVQHHTAYTPMAARRYHLNELISQWVRSDPDIPDMDWAAISDMAHSLFGRAQCEQGISRNDVKTILTSLNALGLHPTHQHYNRWARSNEAVYFQFFWSAT